MQNDLQSEVFENETVEMIEHVRVICDLKTLLPSIKKKGAIVIGLEESAKFVNSVRCVTGTLRSITDDNIVYCYRLFLRKLEQHFSPMPAKSLTSKNMIRAFLNTTTGLAKDVEVIVHCMSVAAVKVSVESVVESLVSRYQNHFTADRLGTEESHALEEMMIAENGPVLQHADSVIEAAMESYWKEKKTGWHFVRISEKIKSYTGDSSKVIGRLLETRSKLPFME
jgi:hypothetical protein